MSMDIRTNTLQKYIDVFGESQIIEAIEKAESIKSPGSIIQITNPILRFLKNTTYVKSDRLYVHTDLSVSREDHSYFCIVSAILADLTPEIRANKSYKDEALGRILNSRSGTMLPALNEILVAAYYKYLNLNIALNSSRQENKADIDLIDLPFATDAKTYEDARLKFEAIVNSSAQQIVGAVRSVYNQGLLLLVFEPDRKKFQNALKKMTKSFEDKSIGEYSDEIIRAFIIDNDYRAADFQVNVQPQNVNIFFQANWNFAPSIKKTKDSIEKAVKQAKALSKQAIPWIMVPRDANRNGIEVQVLRLESKFHDYVSQHPDIFAMPVYALDFKGNRTGVIFDVYQTGANAFNINEGTFRDFIQGLMSRPEIYI